MTNADTYVPISGLRASLRLTIDKFTNQKPDGLKIYPMDVDNDDFLDISSKINEVKNNDDINLTYKATVDIPTDEDPFRYWDNQFVIVRNYDGYYLDQVFSVYNVHFVTSDFNDVELEEIQVTIRPCIDPNEYDKACGMYGKDTIAEVIRGTYRNK